MEQSQPAIKYTYKRGMPKIKTGLSKIDTKGKFMSNIPVKNNASQNSLNLPIKLYRLLFISYF